MVKRGPRDQKRAKESDGDAAFRPALQDFRLRVTRAMRPVGGSGYFGPGSPVGTHCSTRGTILVVHSNFKLIIGQGDVKLLL
jgi:hypothetical protein